VIKLAKILQVNTATVVLKLENDTQCIDCKSRCSDGFLRFLFNKNKQGEIIVKKTSTQYEVGHLIDEKNFFNDTRLKNDIIGIKFDETQLLKLSLILYGLPILIMILCLILGFLFFTWLNLNQDLGGIFGFVFGLFLSKFIIKINYLQLIPQVSFFK
jgi:positive regulator of sigma E activity